MRSSFLVADAFMLVVFAVMFTFVLGLMAIPVVGAICGAYVHGLWTGSTS